MSKRIKITEYLPDDKNFNKHTNYGMSLLQKSIEKVGVIESITVSEDDKIISGNARQEKFIEVFGDDIEPIIVESDGKRPVVIKRTDIKSGTKEFTEAAILANTVSTKNINLDHDLIQEIAVEEFDIEELGVDIYTEDVNDDSKLNEKYTQKNTESIFYEPSETKPEIKELFDDSKTEELLERIKLIKNDEVRYFLEKAAQRHTKFNFDKIADFYSNEEDEEVREAFIDSVLVICDLDRAIENGTIEINKFIDKLIEIEQ